MRIFLKKSFLKYFSSYSSPFNNQFSNSLFCNSLFQLSRKYPTNWALFNGVNRHSDIISPLNNEDYTPKYLTLDNIYDNPGARKKKKKLGRGVGSSRGRHCGRGMGGQKAKGGGKLFPRAFEGGQIPLFKRIPKWGGRNESKALKFVDVSLGSIQKYINLNRFDLSVPITIKHLFDAGLINNPMINGIRLTIKENEIFSISNVHFIISEITNEAREILEENNCKVTTVYYTQKGIHQLLFPERYEILHQFARAPPRYDHQFDIIKPDIIPKLFPPYIRQPLIKQYEYFQKIKVEEMLLKNKNMDNREI